MKFLMNLIFPKFCIGCKRIGRYICFECFKQFRFIEKQQCPYCRELLIAGNIHSECKKETELDGVYSLLRYQGFTKVFIKNVKYKRVYSLLEDFFEILPSERKSGMVNILLDCNINFIQPIPLHPARQKLRGFNQSEYIAKQLSFLLDVPVVNTILRIKNTLPQAQIQKRVDRANNIQNAFRYHGGNMYSGKNILLVDDLFTTGSTTIEAVKELKKNGIAKVYVFSLAHGQILHK